ncbi:myelin protein zero-like protein 1 [Gastrophryne carolinensis]
MAAGIRDSVTRGGRGPLWPLLVAVLCVVPPSGGVEVYMQEEISVANGTEARLSCTFKSTEVISSQTTIVWKYADESPSSKRSNIFVFSGGKPYPGERFKDRISWAGDLNKRDASIKIDKISFRDNGTYSCEVMNPPDVDSSTKEMKLRVVETGKSNVPFLVGIICAAIGGLLLIAIVIFAVVITKKKRSRKNYTGCSTTESLMSPIKQPPRKSPSDTEALVTNAPTGTMQGPVIYAQLDHSGKAGAEINKSERVVYADIRKVC